MKHLIKISFIFCLWFLTLLSFGQTDCKVLKAEISLIYKGECKNGLAHGFGEASGKDFYKGKFKNGLPHGEGTYEWGLGEVYEGNWRKGLRHGTGKYSFFANGRDTTIGGRWVNDEYVGEKYKWILNNYHGRPHRSLVYLHQQNPFNLQNPQNPYENAWYDAEKFLLYEFDRLDIETFDFS